MKKITFVLLLVSSTMFSQKITKEQLNKKMADFVCECLADKNLKEEGFEEAMTDCMMKGLDKFEAEVETVFGKKAINNQDLMYQFGTDVGKIMGAQCPEVFESMLSSDEEEYIEGDELLFEGKMILINKTQQFLTFNVKSSDGTSKDFIIMEEFDGIDLITTDKVKVNDKVELAYYESEMYDPKTKKFKVYNVVYNISKL